MSLASPLNQASASINPGVWKRKSPEDEDETNQDPNHKKSRYSWYVTLESESPHPTDSESEDESIYSLQGQETEFAHDTPDTSSSTDCWTSVTDSDVSDHVEYEVASMSESENPFLVSLSSTDPEDFVAAGVLAAICDSDVDLADDSDDSRTTIDSEIGRADYWACVQCHTTNNNPLFRYCEKCYQVRKSLDLTWKPKKKRRKLGPTITQFNEKQITAIPEELASLDSGLGSQEISENDGESCRSTPVMPSTVISPLVSCDSVDTVDGPSQNSQDKAHSAKCTSTLKNITKDILKKAQSAPGVDSKSCIVCFVGPKDGAFVHGRVTHICCCYPCAKKIWKNTKYCPICMRKVTNVLKTYYI